MKDVISLGGLVYTKKGYCSADLPVSPTLLLLFRGYCNLEFEGADSDLKRFHFLYLSELLRPIHQPVAVHFGIEDGSR